ncbi:MAG: molecular chaperone HtpG, partial [Prevotella sp.]|nr:molecular chaperone HtpG [Prevotella sp.]
CNQVFVTDQVEGIVPEFLTLLHGVIDSPDIPLNVSRSYLQSDQNVKKISQYITKKVADRLSSIFKNERKEFEDKWNDISIFINYGMLSEEQFYDKAKQFFLLKDTEGKFFTLDEYKTLIESSQTDKDGQLIYLYAQDSESQYTYIEAAKQKGYSVLMMNGQLDTPLINMLEQKLEKTHFTRVDADIVDNLIKRDDNEKEQLDKEQAEKLQNQFKELLPKMDKVEFTLQTQAMGEEQLPVIITQSEYMRRMKDMARLQPGMQFYGEMPDMYNMVLNTDSPLVKELLETENTERISQLIDLALLQNGMLSGEALTKFVKRSVNMIK